MYMVHYCERNGPHLGAEPLNLISNLSFVIAGVVICYQATASVCPVKMRIFGAIVMLIGLGSSLFHAYANQATLLIDVAAISLGVVYYLGVYLRYVLGLPWRALALALVGLIVLTGLLAVVVPNELTHGSSDYFGVWISMVVLAVADPTAKRHMAAAVMIFSLALLVRTLDQPLCEVLPFGIHFIWHGLNGWLLYHLSRRFRRAALV